MTDDIEGERRFGGRQFVVVLYLALVSISGVMGALFTVAVDSPSPPALFFLFELPPTTVGFALYGALTVAVVLGLPLALVVVVSERVDDVDAVGRADFDAVERTGTDTVRRADAGDDTSPSSERPKD